MWMQVENIDVGTALEVCCVQRRSQGGGHRGHCPLLEVQKFFFCFRIIIIFCLKGPLPKKRAKSGEFSGFGGRSPWFVLVFGPLEVRCFDFLKLFYFLFLVKRAPLKKQWVKSGDFFILGGVDPGSHESLAPSLGKSWLRPWLCVWGGGVATLWEMQPSLKVFFYFELLIM